MIAIAIDDEPIALDVVRSHASKVPFLELKATFTNAFEAISYLQSNKIDLIFLDIKMPDISGIDFLNSLANPPMVVFTTAYSEHAVKSFELDAIDYLLKPFSLSRFLKSCNKALALFNLRNQSHERQTPSYIFVKDGYEQVKIILDDILYLEAAGNYTQIHMSTGTAVTTRMPIAEMELVLPKDDFIRTHRAFIVNRKKVDRFDKTQVYINGKLIPIGATYAGALSMIR